MALSRSPRKTVRENIANNQAQISAMCKLAGKPAPVFSEILKPVKPRAPAKPSIYPTEAQFLKTALKYLRLHPKVAWACRQNSGTFMDGDRFISANSQKGMSDILGMMLGGQIFAIECKAHNGRLMDHQADFLDRIAKGGGLSGMAKTLECIDKILGL
jgi:hypothetical protein